MEATERSLWISYQSTHTPDLREQLVERYLPLVRYNAERLGAKLPQHFDTNDLFQAGVFGLMQAVENFDLAREVKFETFANRRIQGSMLDELRALDWVPRQVRSKATRMNQARSKLIALLGREPSDYELADELGIEVAEFYDFIQDAAAVSMTSIDRYGDNDDDSPGLHSMEQLEDRRSEDPTELVERSEVVELLTKALSKKERLIIILYYFEELTMKEIGATLDLSESRGCQIHQKLMLRMRGLLEKIRGEVVVR
jgi:RNA polymerase sigma factor for flagellar operon FliA